MRTKRTFPPQDDYLGRYFAEISETKLLNFDQELELSRRVEAGDPQAQELLVRANLRLVVKIARGYLRYGVALLDLIQEGNLGLISAAEKYDYRRHVRFSTYASWWIKQSIVRAISNKNRFIRLPHRKEENLRRIIRYLGEAEATGQFPSVAQLALDLNLQKNEVLTLLEISSPVSSLNREINDDCLTVIDTLEDLNYQPDQVLLEDCVRSETREMLSKLLENERNILIHRFSLNGAKRTTLKTLSRSMGLSPETIRQLELRALQKLRLQNEDKRDLLYS